MKSLDRKLKRIVSGKYSPRDFIIADAKDPEMSGGVPATGPRDPRALDGPFETVQTFHDSIRTMVKDGGLDIMLGAVSTIEVLARQGLFRKSPVTAAIRANDATDIWRPRGGSYASEPSRPFRTASLAHLKGIADLGLYSITFNNILDRDYASLEAYNAFRADAVKHKFRHFLEVFNPNAPQGLSPDAIPSFVNDCILRTLAGTTRAEAPLFLKIPFNGRRAMEELAGHDSSLVVGILGGSGGTTRDTFELLHQGEKSGARVALFGRKIKLAESPLDLVRLFRPVIEGEVTPAEAVKAYHARLAKLKIQPLRPLADDQRITERSLDGFGT